MMARLQSTRIYLLLQVACLGLLLLWGLPAFSQNGKISGRLQRNGTPLDFVVIKLQDAEGCQLNAQMTDEFGAFEFKHLEAGVYGLVGEYQGFPIHAKVNLGQDAHVMISLTPSVFRWVPATLKSESNRSLYTLADGGMCYAQQEVPSPMDGLPTRQGWAVPEPSTPQLAYGNALPKVPQAPLGASFYVDGLPCDGPLPALPSTCKRIEVHQAGIPAAFGGAYAYVVELQY